MITYACLGFAENIYRLLGIKNKVEKEIIDDSILIDVIKNKILILYRNNIKNVVLYNNKLNLESLIVEKIYLDCNIILVGSDDEASEVINRLYYNKQGIYIDYYSLFNEENFTKVLNINSSENVSINNLIFLKNKIINRKQLWKRVKLDGVYKILEQNIEESTSGSEYFYKLKNIYDIQEKLYKYNVSNVTVIFDDEHYLNELKKVIPNKWIVQYINCKDSLDFSYDKISDLLILLNLKENLSFVYNVDHKYMIDIIIDRAVVINNYNRSFDIFICPNIKNNVISSKTLLSQLIERFFNQIIWYENYDTILNKIILLLKYIDDDFEVRSRLLIIEYKLNKLLLGDCLCKKTIYEHTQCDFLSLLCIWEYAIENMDSLSFKYNKKYIFNCFNNIAVALNLRNYSEVFRLFIYIYYNVLGNKIKQKKKYFNIDDSFFITGFNYDKFMAFVSSKRDIINEVEEYKIDNIALRNFGVVSLWRKEFEQCIENKIKYIELCVLNYIDNICEKFNFQYFLINKSLKRYVYNEKGISESAVSIGIIRNQYDKLISVLKEDNRFLLHNIHTDTRCWFLHTNIGSRENIIEYSNDRFFDAGVNYIGVNIFPVDTFEKNNSFTTISKYRINRFLRKVLRNRVSHNVDKIGKIGKIVNPFIKLLSTSKILQIIETINCNNRSNYFNFGEYTSINKDLYDRDCIFPLRKVVYYNQKIYIPNKAEYIVEKKYGKRTWIDCEKINKISKVKINNEVFVLHDNSMDIPKVSNKRNVIKDNRVIRMKNKILSFIKQKGDIAKTIVLGKLRALGLNFNQNDKRLRELKNKHKNDRCFLIGNGPSLSAEDLDRISNEYSIACNLIYKIYPQTKWRPTYYCISDSTIVKTNNYDVSNNIGNSVFLIREYAYRFLKKKVYNAIKLPYISTDDYIVKGDILQYHYLSHATVMSMMIEIAIYMGFKEIYIIGMDGSSSSAKGSHFVNNYFSKEAKAYADAVKRKILKDYDPKKRAKDLQDRSIEIYNKLRYFSEKRGIKIYNATRGGYIEVFDRVNFDDINKK